VGERILTRVKTRDRAIIISAIAEKASQRITTTLNCGPALAFPNLPTENSHLDELDKRLHNTTCDGSANARN
jgi:hypothetical protein